MFILISVTSGLQSLIILNFSYPTEYKCKFLLKKFKIISNVISDKIMNTDILSIEG